MGFRNLNSSCSLTVYRSTIFFFFWYVDLESYDCTKLTYSKRIILVVLISWDFSVLISSVNVHHFISSF